MSGGIAAPLLPGHGDIPAVLPHPKPSRQQEQTPSESISESIRAGRPR